MSKYGQYLYANPEEVVFSEGLYTVYLHAGFRRYILVKNDFEIAFKNDQGSKVDYHKWISTWESNCRHQLAALNDRIAILRAEQTEIENLLKN